MSTANLQTREIEVIPAVLVKTKQALLESIRKIMPYAKIAHIDVMDNEFVPNLTIGLDELKDIPENIKYEFHWMVKNPEKWIRGIKGRHLHLVHVETINENWEEIKKLIKESRSKLGLVINPETPVEKIAKYANEIEQILVMAVHPGFSGQKYIKEVEEKISFLRKNFPKLSIEIDGGINAETAKSAVKAGANKIAAASAIFSAENIKDAINGLKKACENAD